MDCIVSMTFREHGNESEDGVPSTHSCDFYDVLYCIHVNQFVPIQYSSDIVIQY